MRRRENLGSLVGAATVLGAAILVTFQVYQWREPARLEADAAADRQAAVEAGREIYAQQCAVCHGPQGEGIDAPALNSKALLSSTQDEQLISLIRAGVPGPAMPAWSQAVGGPLTDEHRSYLQSALRASEHLQALLTNVLHYAKLELGVERLHPEDVDVAQLARETADALQHLAREKSLHIELDLEPTAICAQVDRTKLRQILITLLQNAIRHTPAGGRIWVGVRGENADGVRLWVRDSGPGIPAEDQQKIFEPFLRLDDNDNSEESARAKEGLGLGLAVVKRYAELHGGRVWVESIPGQGSTFYVSLPNRPCSSPKPALTDGGDKNDGRNSNQSLDR